MVKLRQPVLCAALLAVFLLQSTLALAQQAPAGQGIGVVTSLQGQATVGRQALPQPAALRFKDDVFFQDRIATRERSTVRLLLGGKGTLTIREQSQVTLDESVAPDGTRRSVVGLLTGKIGAAIARGLMRPGEVIEIQTPNAVAAVRGTVLIADCPPPPGKAPLEECETSNFLVVSGELIVTPTGQPPVTLGASQSISVTSTPGGAQAGAIQNVTPTQINDAAQGLQTGRPDIGAAEANRIAQGQVEVAAAVANDIVGATQPAAQGGGPQQQAGPPNNTVTPVTPEVPPTGPASRENILPPGPLVSLDNLANLQVAAGTSLITFGPGVANTVTPRSFSGVGTIDLPGLDFPGTLGVTGDTITHSGAIVTLDNGARIEDPSIEATPLVGVQGTTLTNTEGPVFRLSGGSTLTSSGSGPLLSLQDGATATLAGIMAIEGGSEVTLGPANAVVILDGTSLTLTAPGFSLTAGGSLHTVSGGDLVFQDPSTLTLQAPILSLTNSAATLSGSLLHTLNSTVTGNADAGLVALQDSSLQLTGPSLLESQGSTLGFAGPMVAMHDDSSLSSTDPGTPLLHVQGGSLTLTGAGALLTMNSGGASADVAGSLLAAGGTATIITTGATGPLVQLSNATLNLTQGGSLVSLSNGASVTGSGIVLDSQNSDVSIEGPIFALRGGSHVNFTGGPLVRVVGGSLTAGRIGSSDGAANQVNITGTILDATDAAITLGNVEIPPAGPADTDLFTINAPAGVPQFRLIRSALTDASTDTLTEFSDGTSTYAGLLLVATDSTITLGGRVLNVGGGRHVTTTETAPLILIHASETTTSLSAGSNVIRIGQGELILGGTLLEAAGSYPTGSTVELSSGEGSSFMSVDSGGQLIGPPGLPLLTFHESMVTSGANFFHVHNPGSHVALTAPLVSADDSTFLTGANFLRIAEGGSLASTSPEALINFSGVTFTGGTGPGTNTGGSLLRMFSGIGLPGTSLSLRGSLLSATDSTFETTDSNFINVRDGATLTTTQTNQPLIALTGGSVTSANNIFRFGPDSTDPGGPGSQDPVTVSLSAPLLNATDTEIQASGASFLALRNQTTFTGTGTDPLIMLTGTESPANIQSLFGNFLFLGAAPGSTPPSMTLASGLLHGSNVNIAAGDPALNRFSFLFVGDGAQFSSSSTDPVVHLYDSSLTTSGEFLAVRRSPVGGAPSTVTLAGPLANLTDSSFTSTGTAFPTPCCGFLFVGEGGSLVGNGSAPLLQFTDSTFQTDGTFVTLNLGGVFGDPPGPGSMVLTGPLSSDSGSTFTIGGSYLLVRNGSTLTYASPLPTPPALLQFTNSIVNTNGSFFILGSDPGQPGSTGTLAGPLLAATNSSLTVGGDVLTLAGTGTLTGPSSGSLIRVEGGNLTATGDLVNLGENSILTLNDSVLTVAGGEVAVANVLNVGAPLTTPSGSPVIAVTGSSLSTTGSLATLGANLTLGGPLLVQSAGDVTTGADALVVGSHTLTSGPAPVFALTGGTLTTLNDSHLMSLAGGTANFGGSLLSLAPGPGEITPTVNIGGDLLHVASTVTGPPSGSLVSATAGRLTSGGDFFHIAPGGHVSVSGSLVAAADSTLAAATGIPGGGSPGIPPLWEPNFGSVLPNGRCDDCTNPPLALGFSFPFQGQNFTHAVVSSNGFLWLGGDQGSQCCNPFISGFQGFLAGLGRVSVGWTDWDPQFVVGGVRANTFPGRAVFTWDGVPEYPGSNPPNSTSNSRFQIQLWSDGRIIFGYERLHPLAFHDLLIGVTPGGGAADPGEVHFLAAAPFSTGTTGTVYEFFTTGESFGLDGVALVFTPNASGGWDVSTTGSSFGGLGGAVLSILDGGELTQSGNAALFDLVRTALTSNGDFLRMLGQSRLSIGGRLLNATDSPIAIARSVVNILGGGQFVSTTPDSLVQTTGGSLTLAGLASIPVEGGTLNFTTGSFLQMSSPDPEAVASLTVSGGLLHSSGTPISGHNHFLDIGSNAHVTSTGADAAVVLENSPLTIAGLGSFTTEEGTASSPFGNFLNICCTNSMTLTGPLLLATDSPLAVAGALVSVFGGGRLISSTTDSLVKLVGGTHEIGSGTFSGEVQIGPQTFVMPASLVDLRGITMDAAGLGTDPVLQTGGTIFEANGAIVNLAGSGNAISIDTALLAAAAPIVKLINSTLNTSGDGDPVGGAMRLFQSTVTSLGPVFNLDNSVLTVQSGPLLSLTGGSNMTVTGDFASLLNGSRITIVNGPLIFVDGINAQGTPSTLTVTGGVVNFGGTGGNQVIVNNAIAPTAVLSGLPVNVGGGGSTVTVGLNPIKNPALGTVSINGVLAGPGPHTGSLIQATNGGRVTITAP